LERSLKSFCKKEAKYLTLEEIQKKFKTKTKTKKKKKTPTKMKTTCSYSKLDGISANWMVFLQFSFIYNALAALNVMCIERV
jgi:hypothetical protein